MSVRTFKAAMVWLAVVILVSTAWADQVVLRSGKVIEGTIVLEAADRVMIQTSTGVRTIKRGDVLKIEKSRAPIEIYREKAAQIGRGDTKGHFQLGQWCQENGLEAEALAEFKEAIRIDRDHEGARKELGYVLRGGRWVIGKETEKRPTPPVKRKPPPKEPPPPPETGGEKPEAGPEKSKEEGKSTEPLTPTAGVLTPEQIQNQREARAAWRKNMAEYQGVPWGKAHVLSGTGFELRCNSSREVAEWYFKALEKINYELNRFFRNYRRRAFAYSKTSVYVYKSHEEFMDKEQVPPGVGGFFRPGSGAIRAYHGEFGPSGDTIAVLGHEYTHKWEAVVINGWANMPPWIYEGLAVYFGDGITVPRKGRAKAHQIPRDRLRALKRAILEKRYVKVRDLIRTPRGAFGGFHYMHAWSVIYWMINGQEKGKKIFSDLFSYCVNNRLTPKYFEDLCVNIGGIEGFEERWKKWVLELVVPPPGDVEENTFRSHFSDFSISRPDEAWEWAFDEEVVSPTDRMAFQVAMKREAGQISVLSANNPEHLTADAVIARKTDQLKRTFEVISTDRITANGYEAFEVHYKEKPPEKPEEEKKKPDVPSLQEGEGQDPGEDPEKKEQEKKKPEPPPLKRMRRVYLTTPPHIIIMEVSAPIEEFDAYNREFEKTVQSIQLHFE